VAGHLRRRPGGHEALGDAPPVPLAQLPEAVKELPVLLLGPWNPCTINRQRERERERESITEP
jgi:hypothetical protein